MEIRSLVTDNFLVTSEGETIRDVLQQLRSQEKRAALVFRHNKYLGLVEKKDILKAHFDNEDKPLSEYVRTTPILSHDDLAKNTAHHFHSSNVYHIPVKEQNEIHGVVHAREVAKHAVNGLKVTDVKLCKPNKITLTDSLAVALDLMHDQHVDTIPVFSNGVTCGFLSYKDIIRKSMNWSPARNSRESFNQETRDFELNRDSVRDVLVEQVYNDVQPSSISHSVLVSDALDTMTNTGVDTLLVLQGNEPQGLLTLRNILGTLEKSTPQEKYTVEIKGLGDVYTTEHQRSMIDDIIERQATKLQRRISDPFTLTVHLKERASDGKQREFLVRLRIEYPGRMLASEKSDWDLGSALSKCFNILESELR